MDETDPAPPRPTIADVARAAGVHASTVSRALDPAARHRISEPVAARVAEAAARLGYHPSALAAGLRSGKSRTVGVIVPDLTNPVFPPIVEAIEQCLSAAGYVTLLANTAGDSERERLVVERLAAQGADGVILASAARGGTAVALCRSRRLPAVLVNRRLPPGERGSVPSVVSDDADGLRAAVAHLAGLGHRHIGHLGGPTGTATATDRLRGFRAGMRAAGLAEDIGPIVHAEAYSRAAGKRAMQAILQGAPCTAVATANDLLAMGAYDALEEAGLSVPRDISITGFNDMALMDRVAPPLTTVRIQHAAMGHEAAGLMLRQLAGLPAGGNLRLAAALVVRGSTAPPLQPAP